MKVRAYEWLGRATLSSLLLIGCAPTQPRPEDGLARRDTFDDAVQTWMASQHIPGMALAIAEDRRILHARGYGLADIERHIPVDPDTAFWLCSVSKPILATGVMMLVDSGKLGLDATLGNYLDGVPPAWKNITIRQLLTHTSGIPDLINEPIAVGELNLFGHRIFVPWIDLGGDHSEQWTLRLLERQPLNFPPGTHFSYSNSGYVLLAMVMRKVTGEPYDVFLHERIFKPLGMTRTYVYGDSPPGRDIAVGYSSLFNHFVRLRPVQPTIEGKGYACGGLVTTVLDFVKFDSALASGKLVSPSTLEQMWSPAKLKDGSECSSMGLGFGLAQVPGRRWVTHTGRWGGFGGYASFYHRFVNERITIIILANQPDIDWSSMPQAIWTPYFLASQQK